MSDNSVDGIEIGDGSADISDVSDSSSNDDPGPVTCVKLPLAENIAAYVNKTELIRDIDQIECNRTLIENVMNNYVIVKKIISTLPWQEKLLCKHVCQTWYSAVLALQKEQLGPADFVIDLQIASIKNGVKYKVSGLYYTEPLVVFTFTNTPAGFGVTNRCLELVPSPCDPPCEMEHCLIDYVHRETTAPKDCMLTVRASFLSYMPLPQSITYKHTLTQRMFRRSYPFIGGIYIPTIPDVQFHVINIQTNTDMQKEYFEVIRNIAQNRIFKGVLIYVTEKFLLHSEIEECSYLNYFKEMQPDIPYALGGCIVEDTMCEQSNIVPLVDCRNEGNYFVSENLITIGMFTVPKNSNAADQGHKINFEMYSLVLESSDWIKAKIQKTINEFSKKVPRFEHSVVLKLSCVGRDKKHELEEDLFRAEFPNSRLVGCFGNGELGVNHPARPVDEAPPSKRHRHDPGPEIGLIYSYSTVFVYIGWGKMTSSEGPAHVHKFMDSLFKARQ